MSGGPIVTVVTPTTGDPCVLRAIESVAAQTYKNVQHLVVIDNAQAPAAIKSIIRGLEVDVIELPYATGKDRFNGHRIYGASVFLGKGDFYCFLDEDNWFDADHIDSLLRVVKRGFDFAFSFRKIVDAEGNFICNDDCESLGKWPSILGDDDYLIDTSCYFLPRAIAVETSQIWYRRMGEPNKLPPDRALVMLLRKQGFNYETSMDYSVNYRAGNTSISVRREFFLHGNQRMLEKWQGRLPWKNPPAARASAK